MSDFRNGYSIPASADMSVDAGLRSFMLGVYNKLALGLVVAGALAYVTGNVPAVQQLLFAAGPAGRVRRPQPGRVGELHHRAQPAASPGVGSEPGPDSPTRWSPQWTGRSRCSV